MILSIIKGGKYPIIVDKYEQINFSEQQLVFYLLNKSCESSMQYFKVCRTMNLLDLRIV
jgi:hypothetical protein